MGLSITVRGDTAGLLRWLDREDDLRGLVRARPGLPADEEMGVVLVAIATTSALARSVCEYVIDRAALTSEIIIGTTTCSGELADRPIAAARTNVADLVAVLAHEEHGGFRRDHCVELVDQHDANQVPRALKAVADKATDTLLVHLVGHGLPKDPAGNEMFLFLPGADPADPLWWREALPYGDVRDISRSRRRAFGNRRLRHPGDFRVPVPPGPADRFSHHRSRLRVRRSHDGSHEPIIYSLARSGTIVHDTFSFARLTTGGRTGGRVHHRRGRQVGFPHRGDEVPVRRGQDRRQRGPCPAGAIPAMVPPDSTSNSPSSWRTSTTST